MLNFPSFFNAQVGGYEIEQSLRFDGSSHLTRTNGSAPSNQYKASYSVWVKVDGRKVDGDNYILQNAVPGGPPYSNCALYYETNSGWYQFAILNNSSPSTRSGQNSIRDHSAWYHVVATFDHTQSSSADGMKIYVNGKQRNGPAFGGLTAGTWSYAQNQPVSYLINGRTLGMGRSHSAGNRHFAGYMAEFHCVDGQVLSPTDFGEYDDNGVWRPIEYTGTHGNNGWYLKYDPSATNGIGHDHSGNGNNFTPTGFDTTNSTAATYDVMSDTPTTNYCTWNPLSNNGVTISNGNLDTSDGASGNCKGTLGMTSGKWYWEFSNMVTGTGTPFVMGLAHVDGYTPNGHDNWRRAVYFYTDGSGNGEVKRFENGSSASSVTVPSSIRQFYASDVLQIAFDADTGKVWTGKNNSWLDSSGGFTGNPSTGANPTHTFPDTTIPMTPLRDHAGVAISATANFGQRAFAYTPPTGFEALNTANLPAPTIKDGGDHFNTVLWTGNGSSSSRTITGVGFQPDFTWIKGRSYNGSGNRLMDAVRGAGRMIQTNSPNAEFDDSANVPSFASDGFTLTTTGTSYNASSQTYVAWNWKANGAGSSNTDGSITSTVSANPDAGFSIVSYVGTQQADTIAHGLGVAPSMIICKDRDVADRWPVYHSALGNAKNLRLDNTTAQESDSGIWNSTSPTSTVFSVGTSVRSNRLNSNYIAYCFSEVEGYSKFGSYTGNGTNDGVFVHCGFSPRWIMWKETTVGESWFIHDTARTPYNVSTQMLRANYALDEATGDSVDILSNGFKFRSGGAGANYLGRIYIFAAFAEHPTGGSGVSPATAR